MTKPTKESVDAPETNGEHGERCLPVGSEAPSSAEKLREQRDIFREQREAFREQRDSLREQRDSLREQRDSLREQRDSLR